jgi:hypothetical protein
MDGLAHRAVHHNDDRATGECVEYLRPDPTIETTLVAAKPDLDQGAGDDYPLTGNILTFLGRWVMRTRLVKVAALVLLSAICASPAHAQNAPPSRPSGNVTISQVQVAFIGSGAVGGGTLYYRGRAYPFKLGGLGIGGFGVSRLEASGTVYNLRSLQDINGVYAQVRSG